MKNLIHLLIILLIVACSPKSENQDKYRQLAGNFYDPPGEARPKALWTWLGGNADTATLTQEMEDAKDKGIGGFDMWDVGMLVDPDSVVPAGPAFMSQESVEDIVYALKEGKRLDLEMGLTISSSWNAGGSWVEDKHGVMGLFRSGIQINGPGEQKIEIPKPELSFGNGRRSRGIRRTMLDLDEDGLPMFRKDVALLAFPLNEDSTIAPDEVVDLTEFLSEGTLIWDVPDGTWQITRYTCMPTGQSLAVPSANSNGLMLDHFSADATRMHMNYFFEKLIPELGDLGESALQYFYNDSYEANSAAWTPKMTEEFQKLRGYDMTRYLPVLDGFTVKSKNVSERFAYDYRKTLSDMIISNHYELGRKLCHEHGIGYVAEAGGPGPPVHNVPFQDLAALGALDIPRGEFWYKHPGGPELMNELQIIKGISSAAHIYNQVYVEAESFTSVWLWQEGPMDLKPVADKAFCEGLNRIVYHTFPHIPPEAGHPGWIYNFGTVMNTHRAWWPKSRQWNDYLARVSYMMQQGNFVADVAFYYGNEAPNFVGHKRVFDWLGEGYDYDAINTEILLEKIDVVDGRLVLTHGQSYSILVLPDDERMDLRVIKKIESLLKKGATIVGSKPSTVYGLNNFEDEENELMEIVPRIWEDCDGKNAMETKAGQGKVICGKTARQVLSESGIIQDFSYTTSENTKLEYIHRQLENTEIYFVRNADSVTTNADVIFRTSGAPELWDPDNGDITSIPVYNTTENATRIPLLFAPYESYVIVIRNGIEKEHIEEISMDNKPVFPGGHGIDFLRNPEGYFALLFNSPGMYNIKYSSGKTDSFEATLPISQTVASSWEVTFAGGWDAPEQATFDTLVSWVKHPDAGIQTYSGIASYNTSFQIENQDVENRIWRLNLGNVHEVAEVKLNGAALGIGSFDPFVYNITQQLEPENKLTVEVANLLNNQLVGEGRKPKKQRKTKSNVIKLPSAWTMPMGEAPLKESGLIGPVTVTGYKVYRPKFDRHIK